jgi:hypothetical protein
VLKRGDSVILMSDNFDARVHYVTKDETWGDDGLTACNLLVWSRHHHNVNDKKVDTTPTCLRCYTGNYT